MAIIAMCGRSRQPRCCPLRLPIGAPSEAWRAEQFVLLVSEPILAEVGAVTARPELWRKLRMTPREARAVPLRLRRRAVVVRPAVTIRNESESYRRYDKVLDWAVSGAADYVVSADDDLLSLGEVRGIPIFDAATFWRRRSEHGEDQRWIGRRHGSGEPSRRWPAATPPMKGQ